MCSLNLNITIERSLYLDMKEWWDKLDMRSSGV